MQIKTRKSNRDKVKSLQSNNCVHTKEKKGCVLASRQEGTKIWRIRPFLLVRKKFQCAFVGSINLLRTFLGVIPTSLDPRRRCNL